MGREVIMAIGCHPADIIAGAGGTIVNHLEEGDEVIIVSLTSGALSHGGLLYDELHSGKTMVTKEVFKKVSYYKQKETKEACKVLGVEKLIFMEYDDEPFLVNRNNIIALALLIRKHKPTIIVTHYPNENDHDDHKAVGECTLRSVKAAANVILDTDLQPCLVSDIYFMLPQYKHKFVYSGYNLPLPNIIVDISKTLEKKKSAVGKFKSQKYTKAWLDKIFERTNGYTAIMQGLEYAEEFVFTRPFIGRTLFKSPEVDIYSLKDRFYKIKK